MMTERDTSRPCLTRSVYVLLMTSQSIEQRATSVTLTRENWYLTLYISILCTVGRGRFYINSSRCTSSKYGPCTTLATLCCLCEMPFLFLHSGEPATLLQWDQWDTIFKIFSSWFAWMFFFLYFDSDCNLFSMVQSTIIQQWFKYSHGANQV